MQIDATPAAVLRRIEERLAALDISAAAASRAAGAAHIIPNLRKGSAPSLDTMVRLAEVLETTPAYLAFGITEDDMPVELARPRMLPPVGSLPIIGEFAAGRWHDVDDDVDESPYEGIAVPPDPAHPAAHQFAAVVRGTSINKVAPDGSVVSCLDVAKARVRAKDGDLVAVEMTRNGGHQRMRTIKRLKSTADGYELHSDTTDQRWIEKGPIRILRNAEDEGTTIIILGIVTWVHRPIGGADRREHE